MTRENYRDLKYPKDVEVGTKIKNIGDYYIIQSVNNNEIELIRENGTTFKVVKEHFQSLAYRGLIKILEIEVKDTRLARKLYPNAEKLDNGMLRIKER